MDKDKIVSKIKKLRQLADTSKNQNVEEAAAAAHKAQKLMEKYRIAEAMLDVKSEIQCVDLQEKGSKETWKVYLADAIAKHNNCFAVCKGDSSVTIIGQDDDIIGVQKIYSYLSQEISMLCIRDMCSYKMQYGQFPSTNYIEGFYLGAIKTIDAKLAEANEQAREDELANANSIEEKILINGALSKLDDRKYKAESWAKENLDITVDNFKTRISVKGFNAGTQAADSIDVARKASLKDNA